MNNQEVKTKLEPIKKTMLDAINQGEEYEKIKFAIVCLLIIEGNLTTDQAQQVFKKWYLTYHMNEGKNE